jgi:quercetin dioxygenase-like cupin family protein
MTDAEQPFTQRAAGTPTAPGRCVDVIESVEFLPGVGFCPDLGERRMVNFVSFAVHTDAPRHVYEKEQIVLVIEGQFEFGVDGEVRTMHAGDVAVIPSWVPHGARTYDTRRRENHVFKPPSRSLIEHTRRQSEPSTSTET